MRSSGAHITRWLQTFALGFAAIGLCDTAAAAAAANSTNSTAAIWPYRTFRSTNFHPPELKVTRNNGTNATTSDGYFFISPTGPGAEDQAPLIISDDGELIWQGPHGQGFGFRAQVFEGRPVLSYWNGVAYQDPRGFGYGAINILDQSYERIYQVSLPKNMPTGPFVSGDNITYDSYVDIHESFFTDRGTILVTATNVTRADLRSVGGPHNGWVRDSQFYEIEIKTNKVVYRWSSLEHLDQIPLNRTFEALYGDGGDPNKAFNYFHINAVSLVEDDKYLISSRYFCSLFLISQKDGSVIWTLQGKNGGDFDLAPDAGFCYQHDARIAEMTDTRIILHLHDNANSWSDRTGIPTTGLLLELDLKTRKARKIRRFMNAKDPIYAISQGSYQPLPNGHVLLDHGEIPKIEEYDTSGRWIMTAQFGRNLSSYRGYRQRWVGKPKTVPSLAACTQSNRTTSLYMSWNGATEVVSWAIYSGASQAEMKLVKTVPKRGFETSAMINNTASTKYVQVEAKERGGRPGKKSNLLPVSVLESC